VPMARAAITTGVIGIGIGIEKVAITHPNAFPSRQALPVARRRRPPQASPPPHPPVGRSPRIKPSAASLGVVVAADAVVGVAGVGLPVAWGPWTLPIPTIPMRARRHGRNPGRQSLVRATMAGALPRRCMPSRATPARTLNPRHRPQRPRPRRDPLSCGRRDRLKSLPGTIGSLASKVFRLRLSGLRLTAQMRQ
jgi:hypothetical protein